MTDLRDHLEALERNAELPTVDREIDWNLQAAGLAAMSARTVAQAIHFTRIAGYPAGYTLAANLLAGPGHHYFTQRRRMWSRMAAGLELDPRIEYEAPIGTINDRYQHTILPIKVTTAPCKENIHLVNEAYQSRAS